MQYNLKLLSLFVQFDSHLLELSFSREIQTNSKTLIKNVFPESAKEIVHTFCSMVISTWKGKSVKECVAETYSMS